MKTDAQFSRCRNYRYALWRRWDDSRPFVMIVGLNPSRTEDNPTITRCTNFARSWGFGGVCVTNLFAYRAAVPSEMIAAADPVGEENDAWLARLSRDAGLIVAAWGNDGSFLNRSGYVKSLFSGLHCIKMNKSGEPAHPLYLKAELMPVPMEALNSENNRSTLA